MHITIDLGIIIPSRGFMHASFVRDLVALTTHLTESSIKWNISFQASGSAGCNRYFGILELQQVDPEYYLFIDDDMRFPRDIFHQLRERNKDIVGCNYLCRNQREVGPPLYTSHRLTEEEIKSDGLIKTPYMGFGCILVKSKVIAGMKPPYFTLDLDPEEIRLSAVSEDYAFLLNAEKAGFESFVDCRASKTIAHMGVVNLRIGVDRCT